MVLAYVISFLPDVLFPTCQYHCPIRYDANGAQLALVSYAYDNFARQNVNNDARNGTNLVVFDKNDRVVTNKNTIGQTTANLYDSMGRIWKKVLTDGTCVTNELNEFYDNGLLKKTYGSRAYPVAYTYD